MARQDPVERATRGESIYEVTDWEPRTTLDAIALRLHAGAVAGSKAAVVTAGVVVTTAIVGVTGLDLVAEPSVSAMVVLSVLPAVALAAYLWHADVTNGEPASLLLATFLLAVLFAGFAALVNSLAFARLGTVAGSVGAPLALAGYFFLVVGPVEESVKLLAVRLYAFTDDRFDAVIDGAVYGAVAGLGFATIENALYITDVIVAAGGIARTPPGAVEGTATLRALAGPGHVLYSAIAGYYLGLAKFTPRKAGPIVAKGLLVAAVLHGAYNTTVTPGAEIVGQLTPLSGIWALVGYVLAFQAVVGYYLYRKLDRYRRVYHDADAGETGPRALPQRTEFDP